MKLDNIRSSSRIGFPIIIDCNTLVIVYKLDENQVGILKDGPIKNGDM